MPSNFIRPLSDPVFARIIADVSLNSRTRVYWEYQPQFRDPPPYTILVEYNDDYNYDGAWKTLADHVVNQVVVDGPPLKFTGKTLRYGIRLKLTTPKGTYTSHTVSVLGNMTRRQWLQYRSAARRLTIVPRNVIPLEGYLLKRKWHGPLCKCIDPDTEEIVDTDCHLCYGTGHIGGYWLAGVSRLIEISPVMEAPRRDPQQTRPPSDVQMATASILGIPPVNPDDVWVRKDSKRRYYIRAIRHRTEIAGVPLYSNIEMGLADYGDIVYQFPVPEI
jgi:hypothetical protein